MTPEAAIALVESFWEEVWAACNPSAVDRFVTEDFVITSAGVDVAGREPSRPGLPASSRKSPT